MSNVKQKTYPQQDRARVTPIRKTLSERVNPEVKFRLPFVSRDEQKGTISWWSVSPCKYFHQNEEIGRVFCEEALRLSQDHPKEIAEALAFAMKDMLMRGGSDGIAHGFIDRMVAAAMNSVSMRGAV